MRKGCTNTMKQKNIKLYNIIFPIWFIIIFPLTWPIIIFLNLGIDSLIIYFSMKKYKIDDINTIYCKTIVKIVCFGFLADVIGGVVMAIPEIFFMAIPEFFYTYYPEFIEFRWAVTYNPFENIKSLVWVLMSMMISSVLIYILNYKWTFKYIEIDNIIKKKLSLILAITTTPILFLLPTNWFF